MMYWKLGRVDERAVIEVQRTGLLRDVGVADGETDLVFGLASLGPMNSMPPSAYRSTRLRSEGRDEKRANTPMPRSSLPGARWICCLVTAQKP
jgi:hypothetical protein